jgi:hypothetical protein
MCSSRLDFHTLYEAWDPLGNTALRLDVPDWEGWKPGAREAVQLFRGELQPPTPVYLPGYMGSRPMDVMWSGLVAVCVISARVDALLRDAGVTGWGTYPVAAYDRHGEPLPGYLGLSITGRAGPQDRSRGQVVQLPPIVPGAQPPVVRRGVYFDEASWDGSDMFLLADWLIWITTERVKRLLTRAKIRNLRFTPLDEVEISLRLD